MKVFQQGDVVFISVEDIPSGGDVDKEFNGVVQHGEATGHAHRLSGKEYDMYQFFKEGRRYLSIKKTTALKHEEHNPIDLPAGKYEVRIVREVDWLSDMVGPVVD